MFVDAFGARALSRARSRPIELAAVDDAVARRVACAAAPALGCGANASAEERWSARFVRAERQRERVAVRRRASAPRSARARAAARPLFWLRHAAFAMSLAAREPYTHWLYAREDTVFLGPSTVLRSLVARERAAAARAAARAPARALVAVDEHCAFHAESDKAYLANAAGARALFGASFDEHVDAWRSG